MVDYLLPEICQEVLKRSLFEKFKDLRLKEKENWKILEYVCSSKYFFKFKGNFLNLRYSIKLLEFFNIYNFVSINLSDIFTRNL